MTEALYVFGTGGHAREVAAIATVLGWRAVLLVQDGGAPPPQPGPGSVACLSETDGVADAGAAFAIGIGSNAVRATIAARYPALRFPALIHPDASLDDDQRAAVASTRGTVVFAGVRFTVGTRVGDFCIFNLNATVSHDCAIADFVTLGPGAHLAGNVRVGRGAWIGMGATVNQGTASRKREIGDGTVVGSGAVVLDDCAPDGVFAGVPARRIK